MKSVYAGPVMVGDGGSNRNRSGRVFRNMLDFSTSYGAYDKGMC